MFEIKELKKKSYKEVAELLDEGLKEFKERVSEINDADTLNKWEEDLMEEQKKYDEYIKDVKYPLPKDVNYDDDHYTKNDIAKLIVEFLNRSEISWQYTLGYYQIIKLWKSKDFIEIDYNEFDATLRMLDGLKFKGFTDWKNILAVNEYLKGCHEPYSIDTSFGVFLSQKHQAIMDRTTLIQKVETVNE